MGRRLQSIRVIGVPGIFSVVVLLSPIYLTVKEISNAWIYIIVFDILSCGGALPPIPRVNIDELIISKTLTRDL